MMKGISWVAGLVMAVVVGALAMGIGPALANEGEGAEPVVHELDLVILSVVFEDGRFLGSGIATQAVEEALRRGGIEAVGALMAAEGRVGLMARSQFRIVEGQRSTVTLEQRDVMVAGQGEARVTTDSTMAVAVRPVGARRLELVHDLRLRMQVLREPGESGRDQVGLNWEGSDVVDRQNGVLTGRFTQLTPTGVLVEYVFLARINPG